MPELDGRPVTPAGPERWERARRNAELRPNSQGAKLYRSRVRLAEQMANLPRPANEPRCWWNSEGKRLHYTCSAYCSAMQFELALGQVWTDRAERAEQITGALLASSEHFVRSPSARPWHRPDMWMTRTTVDRPLKGARCQVCSTTITPQETLLGVVPPPPAPQPEVVNDHPQYQGEPTRTVVVAPDGTLYLPEGLFVISVTDREYDLLVGTNDGDARRFAEKYGKPLEV